MARCLMLLLIASCCLVLFGFPIRRLEGSDGVLLVELKLEENVTSNSSWTGLIRKQGSLLLSKIRGCFQTDGASKNVPSPKSVFSTKKKNLIMDILTVASFLIFCITILGGVILGSCVYCWQSKKTLRLLKKVIVMKRARTQREDIESYLDIGNYARRKRRTRWSDDEDEDSDEDDSQNGGNRWMEHLQKLFKRSRPKARDEENPDEEDEEDKKTSKPKGRKASYHDPPKDQKRKRAAEIPDEEGDTSKSLKRKIKKVVGKGKRKKVWKKVKKSGKVAKKRLKKLKKKMKGLKKKKVVKKLKKTSKKILKATKKRMKRLKKLKIERLRIKKLHLKQLKKRKMFQKLRLKKRKLKFKKRKNIFKRLKVKRPKMKFRKRKNIFKRLKIKRPKMKFRKRKNIFKKFKK